MRIEQKKVLKTQGICTKVKVGKTHHYKKKEAEERK